ncbi:MAG: tRNA dihydrouridine(20/20a) synthase DusA [Gemmatimonadetes bacterium]|nr:tRNA dihydrouridine(20/20a) synthase DusA [Gemmatimonadota bacterium]
MLDRILAVAPMMGCTDRHCRYLLRLISPNTLLYGEMIVTGALLHGDAAYFLRHQQDEPVAFQLGGSNPVELARCAEMIEQAGYQEINLNVGCPSNRVQAGGIGACLMREPELVAACFNAMQSVVSIPVTIKCRIGIDDMDSFEFFTHFVKTIHDAGCRTFIVHARKAILGGLSPKDNREIPPLKYGYVYDIQKAFPDAVFVLNGGMKTTADVLEQLEKVKGVMLGRAAYSNPWLLAELENRIFNTSVPDRYEIVMQYRDYMTEKMAGGTHFKHMAKHLLGLFARVPGARAYRRHLSEQMFKCGAGVGSLDEAMKFVEFRDDGNYEPHSQSRPQ